VTAGRGGADPAPSSTWEARAARKSRGKMTALKIDHVALPCFDLTATHRFYTEVLGCPLVYALSGPAEGAWGDGEYLLLAFALPDGTAIDFFTFDGIKRPQDDGLPTDIRHLALSAPTRDEVVAYRKRFESASVPFWTETHDVDDMHLYVTDPNGIVLEILAAEDGVRTRTREPAVAKRTLEQWLATRDASRAHERRTSGQR
jgi:catechol 2,3-dioxygenase-like lactoylglutathione lyase family enzyme